MLLVRLVSLGCCDPAARGGGRWWVQKGMDPTREAAGYRNCDDEPQAQAPTQLAPAAAPRPPRHSVLCTEKEKEEGL